jgi:hypothetical protein
MNRDKTLLVLIGLAADAAAQLKNYETSPELAQRSKHTFARLEGQLAAMRVAIEDVNRANEAELAQ